MLNPSQDQAPVPQSPNLLHPTAAESDQSRHDPTTMVACKVAMALIHAHECAVTGSSNPPPSPDLSCFLTFQRAPPWSGPVLRPVLELDMGS
ncbi:hypothetical protein VDGL01_01455 [Verticillium dahliae]